MGKQITKPTSKEKAIADKIFTATGMNCKQQSCGSVRSCAILCEDLKCGKLSDKNRAQASAVAATGVLAAAQHRPAALWCPTQIVCKPVTCGEVNCGSMKCDGQKK